MTPSLLRKFTPYYKKKPVRSASEEEMKTWLRDRGNRDLIADLSVSRGWEDVTILVLDIQGGAGVENLCMRAVSNLVVARPRDKTRRERERDNDPSLVEEDEAEEALADFISDLA